MKKRVLAILLAMAAPMAAQVVPPGIAGYVSTDGVTWNALTSTATIGGISYVPPARGLYGYNSSTGLWYPCSTANPCAGAGGSGSIFLGLTGDALNSGGSSTATTVVGINGTILSTLSTGLLLNKTSTGIPTVLPAVNGDCVVGATGVWTATTCPPMATPTTGDMLASTAVSGTVTTLHRVINVEGFGDSYMNGFGVPNPAMSFFGMFVRDTPSANFTNFGTGGFVTQQVTASAFANVIYDQFLPTAFLDNGGVNDANLDTCGATAGTNCQKNSQLAIDATVAWQSIPPAFRIFASAATRTGTWTANNTAFPIALTFTGSPIGTTEVSTSSSATATFNVPSSASTKVGLTYIVGVGNPGTFSVSVDGTLQTDFCSGTTTFSNSSCGSQAFFNSVTASPFRQEFTVTGGTTHTVIVTSLSASSTYITSVDWIPPSTTPNVNPVFYVNLPVNANTIAQTLSPFYNTVVAAVVSQERAAGLPIFLVDLINGSPGANLTSDYLPVGTNTTTCAASTANGHPNYCGHQAIEQTILGSELSNGYQVSAYNSTANVAYTTGHISAPLKIDVFGTTSAVWSQNVNNMNVQQNNLPLTDYYETGGNRFGIFGYFQDASTGTPWASKFGTVIAGGTASIAAALFAGYTGSGTYAISQFTTVGGVDLSTGNDWFKGVDVRLNGTLASAATIAPVTEATTLTGATTITTITAPSGMSATYGGCLKFITTNGVTTTFGTGGNIANPTGAGNFGVVVGPAVTLGCYVGSSWYLSNTGASAGAKASGLATLASGTVTVTNTAACTPSSTCVYKLTNCGLNGSTVVGTLGLGAITAGTSFVIDSFTAVAGVSADTSLVCWQIN